MLLLVAGASVALSTPAWALTGSSTTITSVSPTNSQAAGGSVTINVSVTSGATGTVNFEYSTDGSTYSTAGTCGAVTLTSSAASCTTSSIPNGTVDLEAVYSGDSTYSTSTSSAFPYLVTGTVSASVGLVVSPASTQVVGSAVTITANLTSGITTGTVNFESSTNGSTYASISGCGTIAVSSSTAVCSSNTLIPLGTMDLKAVFSGNAGYASSSSPAYPFTVTPGSGSNPVSITSATPTTPEVVGTAETVTATLTQSATGSTVNFESSTNGSTYTTITGCSAVSVSGTTAVCSANTSIPIGTVDLEAVYSGNATYASSTSSPFAFVVTTGTTGSSIAITSATPASPQVAGTSVTFTATVPSAEATLASVDFQYSINGTTYTGITNCTSQTISGTTATCTTSSLPIATVDVNAVYSGNATYAAATSAAYPYLIRTSSITTLTVSPVSTITYGTTATLTATVTTGATGTVTFQTSPNDVTFTGVASCSGVALSTVTHTATCVTTTLPTGTYYVDAVYSGDSTYITSTSAAVSYVVHQGTQSTLVVTSTSGVLGKSLTLATSGGAGTGAITYAVVNGTATGCTLSGATLSVATAGTCLVTATKVADANYAATTSATTTISFVNPVPKATKAIGTPYVGRTTVIEIAGQYFYGQPTIKCSVAGVSVRVTKDTGSLLTLRVTVKSGVKVGVKVFALTFKNGQKTNVKFNLR